MKNANATRPKFGEPWEQHGNMITRADGGTIGSMALGLCPRTLNCVNALAGIANPSAIPALVEAAKSLVGGRIYASSPAERDLMDALAALDAEPVAVPEMAGAALRITLEDMLADIEKVQKARNGTG